MHALQPAPGDEDIDDVAAARSIRVLMIVLGVLYGSVALGGALMLTAVNDGAREGNGISAWGVVLIMALIVVPLGGSAWWLRRTYRKPVYRRVMQYGWRRRKRVSKDLLRGRPLSVEDMPVAAAIVDVQKSQSRWMLIVFLAVPFIGVFNGFVQDGFMRWFQFSLAAYWVVFLPFILRQRRRIIRNYEQLLKDEE